MGKPVGEALSSPVRAGTTQELGLLLPGSPPAPPLGRARLLSGLHARERSGSRGRALDHATRPPSRELQASDFAKSDMDSAAEVHLQESLASTRLLTEKLYRRNPREWQRGGYASLEAAVGRAFDPKFAWSFPELGNARSTDALQLAFRPEFAGDRVFAFGVGMGSMLMQAYGNQTEFFLVDQIEPQNSTTRRATSGSCMEARDGYVPGPAAVHEFASDAAPNKGYERDR